MAPPAGDLQPSAAAEQASETVPAEGAATAEERAALLEKRVLELEAKVLRRDQHLALERETSTKAKKKIRQLLLKLQERDNVLAELRAALHAVHAVQEASGGIGDVPTGNKVSSRSSRGTSSRKAEGSGHGLTSRDLALKERADIVAQLENHLAQMRANLAESEREVKDLEERRRAKEAEWKSGADLDRSVESTQAHWQGLSMIGQQIQEKRRFGAELTSKTRELEEQVAQQRALIEGYVLRGGTDRFSPGARGAGAGAGGGGGALGGGSSGAGGAGGDEAGRGDSLSDWEEALSAPSAAARKSSRKPGAASPEVCEDEALRAFLSAAGPAAEAILSRPPLLASFEEQPPRLSGESIESCSAEERVQVLSLFAAWVAVAGEPPRAMTIEDIDLGMPEVTELTGTLESCDAQVDEWDMTRCPANEATMRTLLQSLASQPLRRLNLGYNALGPTGAVALAAVAPSWESSLEQLGLEMNGLGDGGCREFASALERGLLPNLRVLELGWNELSGACAPALAALLTGARREVKGLRKLGLAGNRLGCEGASMLVVAALAHPCQELDLDLSMNHVDVQPLQAVADWAQVCDEGLDVAVTINLEWNTVDDVEAVLRVAKAVGAKKLGLDGLAACQPLIRLGNNELADVDVAEILELSHGLVAC